MVSPTAIAEVEKEPLKEVIAANVTIKFIDHELRFGYFSTISAIVADKIECQWSLEANSVTFCRLNSLRIDCIFLLSKAYTY